MSAQEDTELSNDRTVLSWTRTALACIMAGAVFAKVGKQEESNGLALAIAFFLFFSGLWLMFMGWRNHHQERKKLRLPREFMDGADSSMIIISVFFVLVFAWAIRLR